MRKLIWATLVAALVLPSRLEAQTSPSLTSDRYQCPAYGCDAGIIPLCGGDYVLEGETIFPLSWSARQAPPAEEVRILRDGQLMQTIRIRWSIRDYACCCPAEWLGDYAEVLWFPVKPGEWLQVVVGDVNTCSLMVQIPNPGHTQDVQLPTRQATPAAAPLQPRGGNRNNE
jgi:hypothetical protein